MTKPVRLTAGCVLAPVVGLLLLFPIAALFDSMNWPMFHSWGMAHGAFIFAWPLTTLIAFVLTVAALKAVDKSTGSGSGLP